jgi:hypothetical protein
MEKPMPEPNPTQTTPNLITTAFVILTTLPKQLSAIGLLAAPLAGENAATRYQRIVLYHNHVLCTLSELANMSAANRLSAYATLIHCCEATNSKTGIEPLLLSLLADAGVQAAAGAQVFAKGLSFLRTMGPSSPTSDVGNSYAWFFQKNQLGILEPHVLTAFRAPGGAEVLAKQSTASHVLAGKCISLDDIPIPRAASSKPVVAQPRSPPVVSKPAAPPLGISRTKRNLQ